MCVLLSFDLLLASTVMNDVACRPNSVVYTVQILVIY